MNGRHDIERVLDVWFVDGPSAMPDRLFEAVFDQVERVPQRRLARLRMRFAEMNPRIRQYSLAAAGLVVSLVGIYLLGRAPMSTPGASASPTASATASPAAAVPAQLQSIWFGGPRPIQGLAEGAGVQLVFEPGGEFWMGQSAGSQQRRLRGTASGAGPALVRIVAGDLGTDCTEGDAGTYAWSLSPSGRKLTLTADADPCATRLAAVPGDYWREDCPTADDTCLGPLDAGTYGSQFIDPYVGPGDTWAPRFGALTYTVPDGWVNVDDFPGNFSLRPADAPADAVVAIVTDVVISNQAESCSEDPDATIGTTAADIVTFLSTAEGVVSTEPEAVTIGGLSGFQIDVSVDPSWTGTCPWSEGRSVKMLLTDRSASDGFAWAIEQDRGARWYFLDVEDGRALLIFIEAQEPTDFQAFLAEVTPVVESFVFNP